MLSSFKVDLQLTTLEFDGLVIALGYYTSNVGQVSDYELCEEEMILAHYASKLTPSVLISWKNRYRREIKRNLSAHNRPRYRYKGDWLLVRVLYRLLLDEPELRQVPACYELLGRLRQLSLFGQHTLTPDLPPARRVVLDQS